MKSVVFYFININILLVNVLEKKSAPTYTGYINVIIIKSSESSEAAITAMARLGFPSAKPSRFDARQIFILL